MHQIIAGAMAAMMLACAPPGVMLRDDPIDGPYRLRALSLTAETHVCRMRANGACEVRIPGTVQAIAVDGQFIAAAVHPLNQPQITLYYYIVRLFDGPDDGSGAWPPRAVRGPYDAKAFAAQAREHGVPAPDLVVTP